MTIIIDTSGTGFNVSDVLARTDDMLNDEDRTRWPATERVRYSNDAMGAIITRLPSAFARRAVFELANGSYQTLPAGGTMLFDVVRNVAADGVTPGAAIRRTDRQLLDDSDPDWHTGTERSTIRHFTYDERTPTVFYVYPPAVLGTKVELLLPILPAPVDESLVDALLPIGREYLEAVVNYVCYRCKAKDSEYANASEATGYYAAFEAALGTKSGSERAASPNQPGASV